MNERLRFFFHERLAAYLFPGREHDFRSLALKHLAAYLRREGNVFLLGPEDLSSLNKVFSEIRAPFRRELGETPLPFSLLPEKVRLSWIRPGKLYVRTPMKETLEKVSKGLDFLVSFQPWQDLWEVVLPATSDPELLFKARDLLWVGEKGPCFYCGLPWHGNAECPGLKEIRPGRALNAYLRKPLKDLGEEISQKLFRGELLAPELQGLYARYYYFLPAFLRLLYYRVPEWSHFSQIILGQEIPAKGGHLLIALESLHQKNFKEAENRFLAAGEPSDYRIGLGLCHLAILQEDYERALYYSEEVQTQDLPPLVKAYVLLLKGRIYEIQKDLFSAEGFYAEALRRDNSATPAAYHKILVSFGFGGGERSLFRLSAHLAHPTIFTLAFIEPAFVLFGKELEKELEARIEKKQSEGLSRLREAEDGLHRLKLLLSEEELSALEDRMSSLRESIYNASFFELEKAILSARELSLELQGYTYRKIREIKSRFSEFFSRYLALKKYWASYPYKSGERNFEYKLRELGTRMARLETKIGKDPQKEIRFLLKEIASLEGLLQGLEEERSRLEAKWLFRRQLATFLKIFVLGEIFLFLFFFTVPSFLAAVAPELLPVLPFNFSSFLGLSFMIFLLAFISALFRR